MRPENAFERLLREAFEAGWLARQQGVAGNDYCRDQSYEAWRDRQSPLPTP